MKLQAYIVSGPPWTSSTSGHFLRSLKPGGLISQPCTVCPSVLLTSNGSADAISSDSSKASFSKLSRRSSPSPAPNTSYGCVGSDAVHARRVPWHATLKPATSRSPPTTTLGLPSLAGKRTTSTLPNRETSASNPWPSRSQTGGDGEPGSRVSDRAALLISSSNEPDTERESPPSTGTVSNSVRAPYVQPRSWPRNATWRPSGEKAGVAASPRCRVRRRARPPLLGTTHT